MPTENYVFEVKCVDRTGLGKTVKKYVTGGGFKEASRRAEEGVDQSMFEIVRIKLLGDVIN